MQNINPQIKTSQILRLTYQKSLFFINNFNELDLELLSKVLKYQKLITNLTEQVSITNFLFGMKDKENCKVRRFESIACRLYSEVNILN